ncbi:PIR protein CIR protein [Plasmodium vinckei vinckei]|uniref:PIR protein CIR protein n=1 Tax=Plasmodium vinckei vinckei TaxID=54757 RepID=A0A449BNW2_PLAVN|nr:PIR protein CIR protein [Plasmodium vinckei vinckei]VEV55124.1 PIR protein CIR protein [Plasmodium vinckei vinckei]
MGIQELCKKFLDYDKIINGEKASTTLEELSKNPKFYEHCRNRNCVTNMDKIGALTTYLFLGINALYNNENAKYFLMWLSDKLFKMHTEKNKTKNPITLDMAYRMYLEKDLGNFRYWSLLNNVKGLKEVNLKHMADFYKLLNHICNTILDYKNNGAESASLLQNSTNCSNQYLSLYNSVPNCSSYYHLLDNLKGTYDKFRNPALKEIKKKNPQLAGHLQTLTTPDGVEMMLSVDFKTFDFSDEKCKRKTKKKRTKSKETTSTSILSSPQSFPVSSSQDNAKLQEPQKSGISPQSGTKGSDKGQGASKSEKTDSGTQKGNSNSEGGDKGDPDRGKENEKANKGDSGDRSFGVQGDQGKSYGNPGGGKDSRGGVPGSGANGGAKGPRDQDVTDPSEKSNEGWLGNWVTNFNPMSYIHNASSIYETPKDILTNVTNQVNNAYKSAMNIAKDTYNSAVTAVKTTYDNTMTTVKGAYSATTNYISGAVSSITNQLSSLGSFSQLGYDQSDLGGSGNSLPTDNNPPTTTKIPDPISSSPPSSPPSPSIPQSQSPSDSQTRSDPPLPKSPDSQGSSTQIHKCPVQQIAPTGGNIASQTPPSGQDTLSISGNNFSNTKNENVITVANIKVKEAPSIWCIGPNTKCDITDISIIIISTFIILTIMYKYLSLGWTSKSKRKKTIKKVINSIGGKRPVQIIIKSYDRNKDLKPVINSIGRKKDPLLNIYKLMQADPIPFINLFFLLIFFVYKRKSDFLEL